MAHKAKILLVDGDTDFIDRNRAFLEQSEYEVVTACSGQECLEKAKLERPDAIVLEVMMEEHDSGFTCARHIKSDPNLKDTPILMLSSVAEKMGFRFSLEQDGYWMKTDDFADKPLSSNELTERIEKLLARAGSRGGKG